LSKQACYGQEAQQPHTKGAVAGIWLVFLCIDDHLPYPAAILQVFGQIKHRRRRKKGRGRKRKPTLKPPPNLLVGVVKKVRDALVGSISVGQSEAWDLYSSVLCLTTSPSVM
jgi:hypothetical protein